LVSARPSSARAATGHPAVADRPSLVSRYTDRCCGEGEIEPQIAAPERHFGAAGDLA
jgi:hypothetical protein